jgi:predicted glycosyltransferase involved in capsule biosynthesis
MEKQEVDVVIPLSGTNYIPYLSNCLASLRGQTFPWCNIGVILSCVMHEKYETDHLCRLAMKYEAAVVFSEPRNETFSRGFALNVGARYGSRPLIAFIDADVVLHKNTIRMAVNHCVAGAVMVVMPVVRTDCGPDDEIWTSGKLDNDKFWSDYAKPLQFAKWGYGNSVVNRAVFKKIHGHDEDFYGWGGIDTDIYKRMQKMGNVVEMKDTGAQMVLHQKHGVPLSKREQKHTERNRELLDRKKTVVRNPEWWGRVRSR